MIFLRTNVLGHAGGVQFVTHTYKVCILGLIEEQHEQHADEGKATGNNCVKNGEQALEAFSNSACSIPAICQNSVHDVAAHDFCSGERRREETHNSTACQSGSFAQLVCLIANDVNCDGEEEHVHNTLEAEDEVFHDLNDLVGSIGLGKESEELANAYACHGEDVECFCFFEHVLLEYGNKECGDDNGDLTVKSHGGHCSGVFPDELIVVGMQVLGSVAATVGENDDDEDEEQELVGKYLFEEIDYTGARLGSVCTVCLLLQHTSIFDLLLVNNTDNSTQQAADDGEHQSSDEKASRIPFSAVYGPNDHQRGSQGHAGVFCDFLPDVSPGSSDRLFLRIS